MCGKYSRVNNSIAKGMREFIKPWVEDLKRQSRKLWISASQPRISVSNGEFHWIPIRTTFTFHGWLKCRELNMQTSCGPCLCFTWCIWLDPLLKLHTKAFALLFFCHCRLDRLWLALLKYASSIVNQVGSCLGHLQTDLSSLISKSTACHMICSGVSKNRIWLAVPKSGDWMCKRTEHQRKLGETLPANSKIGFYYLQLFMYLGQTCWFPSSTLAWVLPSENH